ncbi:hypothetical protein PABG_03723 [Paracoccidioides brasiliensis Pb03]|nr:hypothetical protein PABG_03723 [Paracoccidioides brasiliensis Pb03]
MVQTTGRIQVRIARIPAVPQHPQNRRAVIPYFSYLSVLNNNNNIYKYLGNVWIPLGRQQSEPLI